MAIIPKGLLGSDFDDPKTRGILGLAQGLLAAGGYQDRPTTLGQVLAAGAGAGMTAYEQAKERQRLEAEAAEKKKIRDTQLKKSQQELAEKQRQRLNLARFEKAREMGFADMTGKPMSQSAIQSLAFGAFPEVQAEVLKEMYLPKDPAAPLILSEGQVALDPESFQEVGRGIPKTTPPKGLSTKSEEVVLDGVRGKAQVTYFPAGSSQIEALGGDPKTGRTIIKSSFIPKEETAPADSSGYIYDAKGDLIGRGVEGEFGNMRLLGSNEITTIPEGALPVTEKVFLETTMPFEKFSTLEKELLDQKKSRRELVKFAKNRDMAKEGFGLLADQFLTAGKTIFGSVLEEFGVPLTELTESQLATAVATGQLNALVGQLRLETVGGGVMTEQDAIRVISRLGGNLTLLNNKQAVQAAIKDVLESKDDIIKAQIGRYNEAVRTRYKLRNKKEMSIDEIIPNMKASQTDDIVDSDSANVPEGISPEDWQYMSEEDKALWP